MKTIWKDILTAVFMGMILPGCILNYAVLRLDYQDHASGETVPRETVVRTVSLPMKLQNSQGDVTLLDMDTYLAGVVLAEMPASFEKEALKAQAVVARTYTQKALSTGGKHGNGAVCMEPSCCQAYITEEAYFTQGGTQEALEKIRAAVLATSGYVLTFGGELIEATYFSCSGGSTEDAAAVWGTDFSYLQAVPSPGEEHALHYSDTVTFTKTQFQTALGKHFSGSPKSWFGVATYTEGGGIASMEIGGQTYSGTELRSLLGLRSTAFSVTAEEDLITITTRGYGHRVGMSQYGADAMASAGSSYEEILAHYYPGTQLTSITQ